MKSNLSGIARQRLARLSVRQSIGRAGRNGSARNRGIPVSGAIRCLQRSGSGVFARMTANIQIDEIREIVRQAIADGRIKVRKKHKKGDYKGLERRKCGFCGVEFEQSRKHHKWCSSNCLNKAWQRRNKKRKPVPARNCWKCGVEFTPHLLPQTKNCESCRAQPGFRNWMRRTSHKVRLQYGSSRGVLINKL